MKTFIFCVLLLAVFLAARTPVSTPVTIPQAIAAVVEPTAAEKNEQIKTGIKIMVLTALKDPESARFGPVFMGKNDNGCALVNARNSFGGYTGMRPFVVNKKGIHENDVTLWNRVCAKVPYS